MVAIPSPGGPIRVPIAGYADDTALYVNSVEEETVALNNVRCFGSVSGLRLNKGKCVALSLHAEGPTKSLARLAIRPVPRSTAVCYLGIHIASARSDQKTWAAAITSTQIRLRLGTEKPQMRCNKRSWRRRE